MSDEKQKPKQNPWIKRTVLFAIISGVIVTSLPYAIQFGVIKGLQSAGSENVSIEDVDFNLFIGELTVKKLHTQRSEKAELDIGLLHIGFDWLPLFKKRLFISALSLKNSSILIEQPDESRLYVGGIEIPLAEEKPENQDQPESSWGVGLDKLALVNSTFILNTPKFSHDFIISDLSLDNILSWEPEHASAFSFNTQLNNATINGDIQLTAFSDQPSIKGHLNISDLALSTLKPFIEGQLTELNGLLKTNLEFSAVLGKGTLNYTQHGSISIDQSAIGVPDIQLLHKQLSWDGSIEVKQATDTLVIQLNGDLSANQHQNTLTSPALHTAIENIHWNGDAQFKTVNEKQALTSNGQLNIKGLSSKNQQTDFLIAALQQLSIANVELHEINNIKLSNITLSDLTLAAKQPKKSLFNSKVISIDSLHIEDLRNLSLGNIQLDSVLTSLNINQQGDLPLINQLNDNLASKAAPTTPPAESEPTHIHIAGITFTGNNVINIDKATKSGPLKKTILIKQFDIGNINSQDEKQLTPITLKAVVDKHSKITTDANIALFSKKTNANIKTSLNAIELHSFSPIISEQIGYKINTGQLNATLDLNIKKNILDGKTNLDINQLALELADADTASKMTSQLPMPLDSALSLLRDDNNDISLSIPIKGDLASPDFNIGDIINTAIGNALQGTVKNYLKYALQPYGLIFMAAEHAYGAATAIKLAAVTFPAGGTILPADAITYLEKIGGMMNKRPGLRIKVCGLSTSADTVASNTSQPKNDDIKPKDSMPTSITNEQRLELAKNRALAVKSHLISNYSIDAKRLFSCAPSIDDSDQAAPPRVELSI